ncbi:hypothetical protein FisN_3Hh533 [Fistulifera solaris]|uniref:Protein phosphatase inhibitor 2 n=1 Tax=Fistulifera solaris TaxID=1519565 RepID=A0A1Z5K352_FISSO|nr:hypothetical protein FisN_3Hh533 [Fistulifera solaris]|eukprot:GAX20616.1 hypothetical protein FisN_3Hh533 [Fistulifera solaris]
MSDSESSEDDRKPSAREIGEGQHRRAKPALRKKKTTHNNNKDRHLKWDEAAIEEHDLLRGTRMKIEEPNTPYMHYDSGAESDDSRRPKSPATQKESISWDTLQTRLDSVAAVREAFPSSPSHTSDHSDVEEERKKEMKAMEFKEHRKRHYNEMELVRKFRAEHDDPLIDDDDEDD